jgi:KDO2-lipid IV(A) lauroyltransferase
MRAALLKFFFYTFSHLPLRAAHALGAILGSLLLVIPNRRRRTAETNLKLCFPDLNETRRRQLMRQSLREYVKGFTELGVLWTRDADTVRALVREVRGREHLDRALARGKGVIVAAPHLGAWEMIGLFCSLNHRLTSLYRAPPMAALDALMRRVRGRFGSNLVPPNPRGLRAMVEALHRGEVVGILPDQVPARGAGSVFAPFFGIQTNTMVLLSRLVEKTHASVVFAYAERLARGRGFRIHVLPAPAAIGGKSPEASAAAVNAMVEQCVRALPEQYQWAYKRFRVRPLGEKNFY